MLCLVTGLCCLIAPSPKGQDALLSNHICSTAALESIVYTICLIFFFSSYLAILSFSNFPYSPLFMFFRNRVNIFLNYYIQLDKGKNTFIYFLMVHEACFPLGLTSEYSTLLFSDGGRGRVDLEEGEM